MAEEHVALWMSSSTADVEGVDWAERPSVIVRLDLHGEWPDRIEGVPVVPVFDVVDPSLKDAAYFAAVEWLGEASRLPGASGLALRETACPLEAPLWWNIDLLLHDSVWLWIRAVESTLAVLERYRPRRVSLLGTSDRLPWLADTVKAVLAGRRDITVVDHACDSREGFVRRRWARAAASLQGMWEAGLDPHGVFRHRSGPRGSVHPGPTGLRLVTLSDTQWFTRALDDGAMLLDVRARRISGPEDGIGFEFDSGLGKQTVNLGIHGVRLGTGEFREHPTTRMTRYTLEVQARRSILYVDNQEFLRGGTLPGGAPDLYWGHFTPTGDAESEWQSIAWGYRGSPAPGRSLLQRLLSRFRPPVNSVFSEDETPPLLATPIALKSRTAPELVARHDCPPPSTGAVVIMTWGDELRWYRGANGEVVYEHLSEGLVEAFQRRGVPVVCLTLNPISPTIPRAMREAQHLVELRHWRRGEAAEAAGLFEAWRSWRGEGDAITCFPSYKGTSIDAVLAAQVEHVLPYAAEKSVDAAAFEAFCAEFRPRAVVFSNFVTSQRHLIAPARSAGAFVVGLGVGCDSQDHLFYGIRDAESGCPRADLYTVWGEREVEALRELDVPLVAVGRSRHDVFAACRPHEPLPGDESWLVALGLPADARRVVVFGDVLCSTNHARILSSAACESILVSVLSVLERRTDVHVLYKPWRGDDLAEVRRVVGKIGHPRLHVVDPDFVPFHNLDVLRHAVAVISSPTSMLAEFASMGAVPIMLRLRETGYYHGRIIEQQFEPFSISVTRLEDVADAVRQALARNEPCQGLSEQERAALARSFGDPDGGIAERLAAAVMERLSLATAGSSAAVGLPKRETEEV